MADGAVPTRSKNYGFMYGHGFQDPDGHFMGAHLHKAERGLNIFKTAQKN
jgi:predicted lactoylglutathione lyase